MLTLSLPAHLSIQDNEFPPCVSFRDRGCPDRVVDGRVDRYHCRSLLMTHSLLACRQAAHHAVLDGKDCEQCIHWFHCGQSVSGGVAMGAKRYVRSSGSLETDTVVTHDAMETGEKMARVIYQIGNPDLLYGPRAFSRGNALVNALWFATSWRLIPCGYLCGWLPCMAFMGSSLTRIQRNNRHHEPGRRYNI